MVDRILQLGVLVGNDGAGYHGAGDSTGAAQSNLRGDKHVRDILVLAKQGDVENDLQGLSVGSHHNEGRLSTI